MVALFLGVLGVCYLGERSNFISIGSFFTVSALAYLIITASHTFSLKSLFVSGLALRLALVPLLPNLSDDFYRFLWDGFLSNQGINPFNHLPSNIYHLFPNSFPTELFEKMNSPNYYTVYPPVNQWLFYFASYFNSIYAGVIAIRLVIIGFEVATFYIINQLLKRFNLPLKNIAIYWLNPLVIIELTGNLHAEGILIYCLLIALKAFTQLKDAKGAVFLALSFCSKLFSLMLLPILLLKSGRYRFLKIAVLSGLLVVGMFSPFLGINQIQNFGQSLNLYFQNFEFNGSIFEIVRWVGFQIKGYDIIQSAGPVLSFTSGTIILIISWKNRFVNRLKLFTPITVILLTYLFFTPIVHPWYVIIPLSMSVFTKLKTPLLFSVVVFNSYIFYDSALPQNTKNWIIIIEYTTVYSALIWDLVLSKRVKA